MVFMLLWLHSWLTSYSRFWAMQINDMWRTQNDLKSQKMDYPSRRFLYRAENWYSCYTHHRVPWYGHCNISMATQWASRSSQFKVKSEFSTFKTCYLLVLFVQWVRMWANKLIAILRRQYVIILTAGKCIPYWTESRSNRKRFPCLHRPNALSAQAPRSGAKERLIVTKHNLDLMNVTNYS